MKALVPRIVLFFVLAMATMLLPAQITTKIQREAEIKQMEQQVEEARRWKSMEPDQYIRLQHELADLYYRYQDFASARTCYWEYFIQAMAQGCYDSRNPHDRQVLLRHALSSYYLGDYEACIARLRDYFGMLEEQQADQEQCVTALCWLAESYIRIHYYENAMFVLSVIAERVQTYRITDSYTLLLYHYVDADLTVQLNPAEARPKLSLLSPEGLENGLETFYLSVAVNQLMANYAMRISAYDVAIEFYQAGIDAMEKFQLTRGDDYWSAYFGKMLCMTLAHQSIVPIADKLNAILLENIHDNFHKMTEAERAAYWERYSQWLQFYLPRLSSNEPTSTLSRTAYTGLLIAKGMLLRSTVSMQDIVLRSGNEELAEMQDQIQYLNRKLQMWQQQESEQAHQEIFNNQTNLSRLQQRVLNGLKALHLDDFMDDIYIDVDSVRAHLQRGEAAIEFVGLNHEIDGPDSTSIRTKDYVAFVLRPEYNNPHVVNLCNSLELPTANVTSAAMYEKIWQPLEKELRGVKRLYFAPDAGLYSLPIEYASADGGESVFETYEVYRLSSTRELVQNGRHAYLPAREIAIFGNVDYDESRGRRASATTTFGEMPELAMVASDTGQRGAGEIESDIFAPLVYSREEIYHVAAASQASGMEVKLYEEDNATEERFRGLSGHSPDMLMLSTHGYLIDKDDQTSRIPRDKADAEGLSAEDEAMSRSGLVLAGANQLLTDEELPSGREDGFVSARDLASMNLDNVQLAILSACETGLGDVSTDGVYGLQRGFKKAGVQALLMSLWKVDDKATSIFIRHFYTSYLLHRLPRKALEESIQYLRSVDNGRWNKPQYWAAFVLLDGLE